MGSFLTSKMVAREYYALILIICGILAGCSFKSGQPNSKPAPNYSTSAISDTQKLDWKLYRNNKFNYSIQIPEKAYRHAKSDTGASVGFGTIPFLANPKPDDFEIGIDVITKSLCHSLGVSKPQVTEDKARGITTQWGRVDYWDSYDAVTYSQKQPTCQPSTIYLLPEDATPEMRSEWDKAPQKGQGVYALCSEHGGKQVLICISEITDNPKLAEEIFRTFRWTDQ